MTYVRKSPAALLAQMKIFQELPDKAASSLGKDAVACRHQAGETLYLKGQPATRCLLLEQGRVSLICNSESGTEYVRNQFAPGGIVGLPVMFMENRSYPATARAETTVLGYWISASSLERLCTDLPGAALAILRYTSGMLRASLESHYSLATTQCAQRLAGYLLELHERTGNLEFTMPLKIGQLATNLGVSSETLSRLLAHWRKKGLIAGRGARVAILELEGVKGLSRK